MLAVVWRLEAPDFDVEQFLSEVDLQPDVVWYQGRLNRRGIPHQTSGCSLTVADSETVVDLLNELRAFLQTADDLLTAVQTRNLTSTMDVGVTVGSPDQFTVSIRMLPSDLRLLADYGITLELSAYPVGSDE
jgi:hypothetical protein